MSSNAYKILGLLRHHFGRPGSTIAKRSLYLSLIWSRLTYCSPLWRPFRHKDILSLEKIQRRCTKYILNDFVSDYKSRLIQLHLLPLAMVYDLVDISFCLKSPSTHFNVLDYVSFHSSYTRSGSHLKLQHKRVNTNLYKHYYPGFGIRFLAFLSNYPIQPS